MVFKRLICGSNSAVAGYDELVADVWDSAKPSSYVSTTLVGDFEACMSDKLPLIDLMGDLDTINETETENTSDYDSDSDSKSDNASEYEEVEVESDDEYEFYEVEVEDEYYEYYEEIEVEEEVIDEDADGVYSFAKLLGKRLVSKTRRRQVRTDDALNGSSVVALYYADASSNQLTTERLSVFSAGYEEKSFSVVYCAAPKRRRRTTNAGFKAMPEHWLVMPAMSTKVKRSMIKTLNIDANEPCLIVFDAKTGAVVSCNSLQEIADLDPASLDYDTVAHNVFQNWIASMGMEQDVIGEKEVEL